MRYLEEKELCVNKTQFISIVFYCRIHLKINTTLISSAIILAVLV